MNKSLKEKILEYYDVDVKETSVIMNLKGTKNYIPVGLNDRILYIGYGIKIKDLEEAERLVKEGKVDKITQREVFKMFIDKTEDEIICLQSGYDMRTHNYLKAVEDNIGYIESDGFEEAFDMEGELFGRMSNPLRYNNDIYLYKLEDGRYAIQYLVVYDIDGFFFETHYYNRRPTQKVLETTRLIQNIKGYFRNGYFRPEFKCWECGREAHWLDIPGSLEDKIAGLKEQYCGC